MRMKIYLIIFALLAAAVARTQSTDKPIDLTGADADEFRSQVGHTVMLRGRLEEGKQGSVLVGATAVSFYVISEMPPLNAHPKTWTRFLHQQVRLTGELKFRSFDRSKDHVPELPYQVPPDYFYMVLQHTKIEPVESK